MNRGKGVCGRATSLAFGVLVAVAPVALIASASFETSDLVDPADTDSAIDLAELPLRVEVLRRIGLSFQDAGLKRQFDSEFQLLQELIGQSVTDRLGCLLKVRIFVSPEGAIAIPAGQLIAFVETGTNPTDALAKSVEAGYIVAPELLPPPFENQSYYIWIKREKGALKAGAIPREFRDVLEKQAREEVERRVRLASVSDAAKTIGIDAVSRDQFWSEMAEAHSAMLRDEAERQKMQKLVEEFATAQRRFNEAYEQYLEKEQELREQQQNVKTLQLISGIVGTVSSGIRLGELASSANASAAVSAPSTGSHDSAGIMIKYYLKQTNFLNGDIKALGLQIDVRGATLQQANDRLVRVFQDGGIKIPDSDKKLVLPPKR